MEETLEHWWQFPECWEAQSRWIPEPSPSPPMEKKPDDSPEVAKFKKALRFYRDATNYELDMDGGDIARKALGEGEYAYHRT